MNDLLALLQEFHREKLAMVLRHEAGARLVGQYDVNNTYQYVINREDMQLSWLSAAIADLGGSVTDGVDTPGIVASKGADAAHAIIEGDAQEAQAFVDRWRPRVEGMANARHAKLLGLVLGETLEQKRFFEQALAGRTDLLGRRGASLGPSHGDVLPSRWIE